MVTTTKRTDRCPADTYVNGYKVHMWTHHDRYIVDVTDRYGRTQDSYGTTVHKIALNTFERMVQKYREKSTKRGGVKLCHK